MSLTCIRRIISILLLLVPGVALCQSKAPLHELDAQQSNNPRRLEILFLGHKSKHHDSERLADKFTKEYFKSGFNISYTTDPNDLNEENLNEYDGLILYANYDSISSSQEKALLDFVNSGRGFIPLHSASHCFRNSPKVVALIGGQFKSHGYDSFPAIIKESSHPVMKNIPAFATSDETYIHYNLSNDIHVLSEREDGTRREPYTWIKNYGKGRVFYTAYGHDEHTFNNKGFLDLVKNGILWAVGNAADRLAGYKIADPEYFDGPVPNYEKRDPSPKVQKSLSAEESMSLMQVPVGFELKLFAAEPDVVNPIYMNWDERGRLWVIETVDYPNEVKDDDIGDDRIKILEDTNGDGRADKSTIFADKLNIPTSFAFVNGGIIVSLAPSFLFLKDTDGDDKADVREEMLSGWGKFDTHAQASNLRYGVDNKIWGVVGYSGFAGKLGKDSLKFGQGVYRFSPDGKELEYLSNTSNNTWGLGFSEDFDIFISTANNTHTGFLGLHRKYFDKIKSRESGVAKIDAHYGMHVATKNLRQVDVHGGFTAAAGHSLYTARNFPKEYWNRVAFVTEPTGRVVHKTILKQNGSGFIEDGDGWNILTSADEWAGPVQAEVGPDGALWIADWYDFIIQHNPTPNEQSSGLKAENGKGNAYINPLRDHERGRIYRIVYKKNADKEIIILNKKDTDGLIKALSSDNMFWRTTAQRLLVEKADVSVLPELYEMVQSEKVDDVGLNAPALHALWTIHGLNAFDGKNAAATAVLQKALRHPAAGVRRAAVQMWPRTSNMLTEFQKAKLFNDKDMRVRLAALLAVIDMKPSTESRKIISAMMANKTNRDDAWIGKALEIAKKINSGTTLAAEEQEKKSTNKQAAGIKKPDQRIVIKVVKDVMKFDKTLIEAKAGTTIEFVVENPDFMQHNLVLLKPNSLQKVGAAADKLAQDADGAKMNYVPKMPEVLGATPLINPGGKYTLTIKIPAAAGDYPFVCTFPGHWRIMNGVLRVSK